MPKKDPEDEPYDPKKHDETHYGHPANSDEYNADMYKTWNSARKR